MPTIGTTDGTGGGWVTASGNNDGGTIVRAGNADFTGPISSGLGLNDLADDFGGVIGSLVVENDGTGASTTDRAGVDQVVQERPLAYNATASGWIMRGGRVTTTLGGSGITAFDTPGTDYNGVATSGGFTNRLLTTRTLGSGNGTFDVYAVPSTEITPNYTKGASAGDEQSYVAPTGTGGDNATDDAASTTRNVPGELTYHYGALAAPTTDEYKAVDTFES